MSFIAATLLLIVMDAPIAFRCFCNMVARHTYFDIVRLDAKHVRGCTRRCPAHTCPWLTRPSPSQMVKHINAFRALFARELPQLYWHFEDLGIEPSMYIMDWCAACSTYRVCGPDVSRTHARSRPMLTLDDASRGVHGGVLRLLTLFSKSLRLDLACRVWDVYFVEGDVFIWRTALGALRVAGASVACRVSRNNIDIRRVTRRRTAAPLTLRIDLGTRRCVEATAASPA